MSSIFQDISLNWRGRSYHIPANRVMPVLARVEEIITLHELQLYQGRGTVPMVKLSQAYGSILRYAGCDVSDEEIYSSCLSTGEDIGNAVSTLLLMMLPPDFRAEGTQGGNVSKAAAKSSKKRIKSP